MLCLIGTNTATALDQPWSVPEVLRPLYESSTVLAQKMTMAVSRHLFLFFKSLVN